MDEAFSTHWKNKKNVYNLVGKHEGSRPLGKPRCRGEDKIRMDIMEMGAKV
jgi:hypothetical protein